MPGIRLLFVMAITAIVLSARSAFGLGLGDILVADELTSSILIVDPSNGTQTVLTSGSHLSQPAAVGVSDDLKIFVVEGDRFGIGSQIVRVDATSGAQTVVASGGNLLDPNDLTIHPNGFLYIADFSGPSGLGGLIRINPATGAQFVIYSGNFGDVPFNLAVEATGTIVFTSFSAFGSSLYRIASSGGMPTLLNGDVGAAQGVAIESNGNILIADGGAFGAPANVFRVDRVSGARTTVSTGGLFGYLRGIDVGPQGDIYVCQADAVIRVDPVTGGQTMVSSGQSFQGLSGLAVVPGPPPPPPPHGLGYPKLALHVSGPVGKNPCAQGLPANCSSARVTGALSGSGGPFYFLHVLAVRNQTPDLSGISFGISYENGLPQDVVNGSAIDVFSWNLCANAQFPGATWPAPGASNRISWTLPSACQDASFVSAGFFYVGAYSADTFRLVREAPQSPAFVTDCLGVVTGLGPEDLGYASFSLNESLQGCNPCIVECALAIPVQKTTWSAIKAQFHH